MLLRFSPCYYSFGLEFIWRISLFQIHGFNEMKVFSMFIDEEMDAWDNEDEEWEDDDWEYDDDDW